MRDGGMGKRKGHLSEKHWRKCDCGAPRVAGKTLGVPPAPPPQDSHCHFWCCKSTLTFLSIKSLIHQLNSASRSLIRVVCLSQLSKMMHGLILKSKEEFA